MDIFIIRDGRQAGPYSEDAVKAFLTEGTSRPTDLGWRKGLAEWRALSEVLKPQREQESPPETPSAPAAETNGAAETFDPATAKQKAFLKYLGAEFGENLTRQRAAIAVSDALETPKLQVRIRKWHDDKLRQHGDIFQDEIDYRRANRTNRYLERIQTEGTEVVHDVTKAHVQVLVESLDKRHPGWESEREAALWDYLLPAVGEHFPQLVLPAYKARLRIGGTAKIGSGANRGTASAAGLMMPPPAPTGTLGAMMRGVALGVIALGAIVFGRQFWQDSHGNGSKPAAAPAPAASAAADKTETPPPKEAAAPKEPAAPLPEKLLAEAKAPDAAPEAPAVPPAAPAPVEPAAPPAPPMAAEKPAPPEEKPAAPAPAETPAMSAPPAAPAAPRTVVSLTQGIGVNLPNGQVALPAGTQLRYLGTEGQNIRVSWNNNVFFVPALATDVNEPVAAAPAPAAVPPLGAEPGKPATPEMAKPKKPADDL
jgi:GYF domain 2